MTETIALFGAGGKMGVRLSKNLMKSDFRVRHVSPATSAAAAEGRTGPRLRGADERTKARTS